MTSIENNSQRRYAWVDVLLILCISLVAQLTHFSYQKGRTVLNGDSAQYVDAAQAIVNHEVTADFSLRKPLYPFFLALILTLTGALGWQAIFANHLLLIGLPSISYGIGAHMAGRRAGWLSAVICLASLQQTLMANRLMTESLYTVLASTSLLLLMVSFPDRKSFPRKRLLLASGIFVALAWLTRGSAVVLIAGALVVFAVFYWKNKRKMAVCGLVFLAPVCVAWVVECSLNGASTGYYRTSSGAAGASLLYRMRHNQGEHWPAIPDVDTVHKLLPERGLHDAYMADLIDYWVARHRAIAEQGMTEWEYDALMGRVGMAMVVADPMSFLRYSLRNGTWHLFRIRTPFPEHPALATRRAEPIIHPAAPSVEEGIAYWYAWYGLPHRTLDESVALVEVMKRDADSTAPWAEASCWRVLRWVRDSSIGKTVQAGLSMLSHLWPVLGLLACIFVPQARRAGLLLAIVYLFDTLLIGALITTNPRMQSIWIGTDAALIGLFLVFAGHTIVRFLLRNWRGDASLLGRFPNMRSTPTS